MIDIFSEILKDVLTALYESFWLSVLLSVLFMFTWLYARERGWKASVKIWLSRFKESSDFRHRFLLVLYTMMILFRTLLNRKLWMNPLSDVMGGWWLWKESNGEMVLNVEPIENVMLFIPFTILLLWTVSSDKKRKERLPGGSVRLTAALWLSVKTAFLFSISIEFLQLFLRLGTWQVSDCVYNTLGGLLGGVIYWSGCRISGMLR
ncbi:MAG: VanZ family protein [Clostridiales bacterium]|nr:VanZ family protein [Clostridiales bacterium]